jgi:signal transduction histidine kinase
MAHPGQKPVVGGLKKLLQTAPGAILELDPQGKIVSASRMAENMFGFERGELVGLTLDALIPEVYSSGPEAEAFRKDGWYFPVELSVSSVKSPAGLQIIAAIRDLSDRKRMESRLAAIEGQVDELELRRTEVEKCLGDARHLLRSPLCTVIGFAELLAEETGPALNAKQRRFISHIHKDSLHLLDLINDTLDCKKIEPPPEAVGQAVPPAITS